jgi:hypothetical protein
MTGINMSDITNNYRFQRILIEAAQYRTLRQVFKADPAVTPKTAAIIRDVFIADRDDVAFIRENATA